ncbi:hypothetical protein Acr_15g0005600 [Actinidia rufa]|uniref:Galactose oxidase/kelch repeat superfamily protein n=1 Tax=Actinidia rufa TaxID=165716 RepID=A0A7J0FTE0_9ERIC|nr:hypothetical protein Acr_15g0005600 [Actinidia rufa]
MLMRFLVPTRGQPRQRSSPTCSLGRYEKTIWFRAYTLKGNNKWFAVDISNQHDDDGGGGGDGDEQRNKNLGGFYCAPKCCHKRPTNDILCLDASSLSPRWKSLVPMKVGRTRAMAVVLDGKLYAMGHHLVSNLSKHIGLDRWGEVFNLKTKKWSFLPDPPFDQLVCGDFLCVALEGLRTILVGDDGLDPMGFKCAAPPKIGDPDLEIQTFLFHLAGKLFCLVWHQGFTAHCTKLVVDYSEDGSICPWVLSSRDYCLGRNTTVYNAVLNVG